MYKNNCALLLCFTCFPLEWNQIQRPTSRKRPSNQTSKCVDFRFAETFQWRFLLQRQHGLEIRNILSLLDISAVLLNSWIPGHACLQQVSDIFNRIITEVRNASEYNLNHLKIQFDCEYFGSILQFSYTETLCADFTSRDSHMPYRKCE